MSPYLFLFTMEMASLAEGIPMNDHNIRIYLLADDTCFFDGSEDFYLCTLIDNLI